MPRGRTALLAVAALALPAIVVAVSLVVQRARSTWTDGMSLHVAARDATARDVIWRPPEEVRGAINTDVDEYEPKASPDGTTLVFVRRRPGSNADLVASRWTPDGWSAAEPIASINTDADELEPEFAADGRSLWFASNRDGGQGGYDLWFAAADGDGWSAPTPLGASINSRFDEHSPALTPDGRRLYFASDRPRPGEAVPDDDREWHATMRERGRRRDHDLYTARLASNMPSPCERVDALSTPFDDGAPAISPVGDFLYFASNRPGSRGGFDLYRARLIDDAPGEIERLDDTVNSSANELDPSLASDGFRLYFSSDRASSASVAAAQGDAGDYGIWWTTSREVFRARPSLAATIAEIWSALWPWLLLLALVVAGLLLLLSLLRALWRSVEWRRRFARLSLLAKCLVVSLLLHAVIAALLTLWTVGAKLGQLLDAGGTRVILAGAIGDETSDLAEARSLQASQILAEPIPTDVVAMVATTVELPALAPEAPAATAAPVSNELPDRQSASAMPEAAPRADALPPVPATREAIVADVPAAPPADQPSAEPPPPAPSTPNVAAVAPIVAPSPAPTSSTNTERAMPPRTVTAAVTETNAMVAPTPVADALLPRIDAALPKTPAPSASPAETDASAAPSAPSVAPVESIDAPAAAPTTRPAPADALPERAQRRAIADAERPAATTEVPREASQLALALPMSKPPTSVAPSRSSEDSRDEPHSPTIAPLGDAIRPSPRAAASASSADERAPNLPRAAPSTRVADAANDAAAPLPSLPPSAVDDSAPRMPFASVDAPQPIETFEQRAPETRSELVDRMGGSSETEAAVGRALEWFRRTQASDGRWSCRELEGQVDADAAITGLALLTFLGAGHTHVDDGPYRATVAEGLRWLVARQDASGDLRGGEDSMYGQTIGAVALCEAYAMTRDAALADPARRAAQFVLAARRQQRSGNDADTAVLGWLIMTVESARRAGFGPPPDVFRSAGTWLDSVARPEARGRYAYRAGDAPSVGMTAEAMFVQQILGHTRDESRMKQSAEFLLSSPPRWTHDAPTHSWYYATLALFQQQGDAWRRWNEALAPLLIEHQRTDGTFAGSWDPQDRWSQKCGRAYQTAVCALSLEVYYRYKLEGGVARPSATRQ